MKALTTNAKPRDGRSGFSIRLFLCALVAVLASSGAVSAQPAPTPGKAAPVAQVGRTIDVGKTGFAVKRPVLAAACPHGCPWGELGEFVQQAMKPLGYDIVLCRNCNRAEGPRLVARASNPPAFDPTTLRVGTDTRFDAPVDFGVTSIDNLTWAYRGAYAYKSDGPYRNLRLIARVEDPRYVMIAVKKDSPLTDLAQIKAGRMVVRILVDEGPQTQPILDRYGLNKKDIEAWGGTWGAPSFARTEQDFDVLISDGASPANNPEVAYWGVYTHKYDLRFLELPADLLDRMASDDLTLQRAEAKWGLLRGVDRAIPTVARNGHAVFARADMPDKVAYEAAKAVYEQRAALQWYIRPYSYNTATAWKSYEVPLHPGAEKFYREMGFIKPGQTLARP